MQETLKRRQMLECVKNVLGILYYVQGRLISSNEATHILMFIFTVCQQSCWKVMFSVMPDACLSTGGSPCDNTHDALDLTIQEPPLWLCPPPKHGTCSDLFTWRPPHLRFPTFILYHRTMLFVGEIDLHCVTSCTWQKALDEQRKQRVIPLISSYITMSTLLFVG